MSQFDSLYGLRNFHANNASSAPLWGKFDVEEALNLMRSLKPIPRQRVRTNPANRRYFEAAFPARKLERHPLLIGDDLLGIPFDFDPRMPAHLIKHFWHAPGESRFCEYGPEDEVWMRPLGLGSVETIDEGPFYEITDDNNPNWKITALLFPATTYPPINFKVRMR